MTVSYEFSTYRQCERPIRKVKLAPTVPPPYGPQSVTDPYKWETCEEVPNTFCAVGKGDHKPGDVSDEPSPGCG